MCSCDQAVCPFGNINKLIDTCPLETKLYLLPFYLAEDLFVCSLAAGISEN